MQAVGAAVDHLDDLHLELEPLLQTLGRTHTNYRYRGFAPDFFDEFTASIIQTWQKKLGRKFSPDVRAAWLTMLSFVATSMKNGYKTSGGSASPSSLHDLGDVKLQKMSSKQIFETGMAELDKRKYIE